MMGRIVLHVDILEILTLAWDHPLVTGGLVLMFTPPFFPVVVFFSPLLISTALCAVALISVGHQIEATREREIAGWNARVIDGDLRSARASVRRRPRAPGDERWLDWVQGYEPGSSVNTFESTLMNDMKEEGMKVEFRADEGGIEFIEEDFLDRQIEAFREYERSFSFRSNARTHSGIPVLGRLAGFNGPMEMIQFPNEDGDNVSAKQIPPMYLYNLKTGGTGTKKINRRAGAFPNEKERTTAGSGAGNQAALPFGSFDIAGGIDPIKAERDEQWRNDFERGSFATFEAETPLCPVDTPENLNNVVGRDLSRHQSPVRRNHSLQTDFPGSDGTRHESPIRRDRSLEMDFLGIGVPRRESPVRRDRSFETDFARRDLSRGASPIRRDYSMEMDFAGFNTIAETQANPLTPLKNLSSVAQKSMSRQSTIRRHQPSEMNFVGFNASSTDTLDPPVDPIIDMTNAMDRDVSRQRSIIRDHSSDFTGFKKTSSEPRLIPPVALPNLNNVREDSIPRVSPTGAIPNMKIGGEHSVSVSRKGPINPDYSIEWDFVGFKTTDLGAKDIRGSSLHQSPIKSRFLAPGKPSEATVKFPTYNATLRVGNAVIYNASSECGSDAAMEPRGSTLHESKKQSNRDRRGSTSRQKRRHLARERSSKHPFQLDIRNSDEYKELKAPYEDR